MADVYSNVGTMSLNYKNNIKDMFVSGWKCVQQKHLPSSKDMVEEDATVKLPNTWSIF